jgi:hypothetical protein
MHRSTPFRLGVALGAVTLLVALVPSAIAATPRKDAGYEGVTSQKSGTASLPVNARVSKDGKKVLRFNIQWNSKCDDPARVAPFGLSVPRNMTLTKGGSFGYKSVDTRNFPDGSKTLFTSELKGKFTKKTLARGTFKVDVSIRNAAGAQIGTCSTGTINWQVRD